MKTYKAICIKCGAEFNFTEKDLLSKIELDERKIAVNVGVCCSSCGLKLAVANIETRMSVLTEYTDNGSENR